MKGLDQGFVLSRSGRHRLAVAFWSEAELVLIRSWAIATSGAGVMSLETLKFPRLWAGVAELTCVA